MPISLIAGLFLQELASLLRPTLSICIFFMLTLILTRVTFSDAIKQFRNPKLLILTGLWALIGIPAILLALTWLFDAPDGIKLAGEGE